jgi:hypothetical protein
MTNNPSNVSTTISLRVSHQLLARIDDSAKRAGQGRNAYILNWLPEYHSARCDTAHVVGGETGQRPHASAPAHPTA